MTTTTTSTTTNGTLTIAMAQYSQLPIGKPFGRFANSVRHIVNVESQEGTHADLVLFPEMHLFGTGGLDADAAFAAQTGVATDFHDELAERLAELARELHIWLIPGTVAEKNPRGDIFNTAPVFSPDGELVATYRKICPWRPFERYTPGGSFTVFDIPGRGRVGLTICYDAWFPEISRQVAWMGADLIVNLVRTTTPDRRQELVLAQSNAIVNQTFVASVNAAGPHGVGDSILVDPEGTVIGTLAGEHEQLLVKAINLDRVRQVHQRGTAGSNRIWEQFHIGEPPIRLPLYSGTIDPTRWHTQA
ncbi:carbon-nitrogen hydrolase family protein [Bifidobacterium sp. 82T24]|uniref:carbon-nitrogen hydrolase family protein n=1 Tax=Bifidobacterium pluvialisilvae TaxID=2834436 RepID=UPI001C596270|nr:carbon-nitrogen hydrolase family protein [Bifidobacterium pluvialisilvae]MBW3088006.1 carbon-nitrogen hydrolase family protein [Bifidobacterium pluvialisilvae]